MTVAKMWVQHDTKAIAFTLKDALGVVVDLTGHSAKFYMRERTAAVNKVNGLALTITGPTVGECEYRWAAADVDTAGVYNCEIELTDSAGKLYTTERLVLNMRADLG